MTPKRAFWEAVGTVAVPSLLIWVTVFYFFKAQSTSDEWLLWAFLVVLPLPLVIPLYHRYLKGPQLSPNLKTPFMHWTLCVLWIVCGAIQATAAIVDRRSKWHLVMSLAGATIWVVLGLQQIGRAREAKAHQARAQLK